MKGFKIQASYLSEIWIQIDFLLFNIKDKEGLNNK